MGLMDALRSAQSSLTINAARSAAIASNVSRAGEKGYARREAPSTTDLTGARLVRVRRAHDASLVGAHLTARSTDAGARVRAEALSRLSGAHGGPAAALAPGALIAEVKTSLQAFAAEPDSVVAAEVAVDRMREAASGLNAIAREAAAIRTDADAAIARDVETLRGLLDTFSEQNGAVMRARRTGADGSDAADARARTLLAIADIVDIEVRDRPHGDMVLLAGGGAVLHESVPRPIRFTPTASLGPSGGGSALTVDGHALGAGAGGRLGAAIDVRDTIVPRVAERADALASALVAAFADAGGTGPFTASAGADAATSLTLHSDYDPERGGDALALRDGAPPIRNPSGEPGFANLLIERIQAIDAPRPFDPALGMGDSASLAGAAAAHLGQLERERSAAEGARTGASASLERAHAARTNALGVNVDEEMSALIEIEQSHRASARIIAAVDAMLDDLLRAVR